MIARRTLLAAGAAAFALPATARAQAATQTRLRLAGDRVYLPASVNGVAVEGLLDSAAETSILDAGFAAALGLGAGLPVTAHGTGIATTTARLVPGVAIAAAGLVLQPRAVAVIDLGDVARRLGSGPIGLIVGRDLFDAARLGIDLAAATLTTAPPSPPPGVCLGLRRRRGIETVPLVIEGRPATADFDLGNGGTVLVGADFAQSHGLLRRPTGSIPGGGIGGATWQTTLTLATLDLAGVRFSDVPVAVDASPTAADANIGVRLLRRFGLVTDFGQRSIWLDWRG